MLLVNMLRDMRTSGRWSDRRRLGRRHARRRHVRLRRSTSSCRATSSKARGLGLSQQLMRALDGSTRSPAADRAADAADDRRPARRHRRRSTTSRGTGDRHDDARLRARRTGWNGMRLDPPAPGNSGAQWARLQRRSRAGRRRRQLDQGRLLSLDLRARRSTRRARARKRSASSCATT